MSVLNQTASAFRQTARSIFKSRNKVFTPNLTSGTDKVILSTTKKPKKLNPSQGNNSKTLTSTQPRVVPDKNGLFHYPQKINLIWTGGNMSLRYQQYVARIAQGSGKGGPKVQLFVDDPKAFNRHWQKTANGASKVKPSDKEHFTSSERYDLPHLPTSLGLTIRSFDEIPEATSIEHFLGHMARTDRMLEGRNKAVAAADIRKCQVADAEGGLTIDIRSALPARQYWASPKNRAQILKQCRENGIPIAEDPETDAFWIHEDLSKLPQAMRRKKYALFSAITFKKALNFSPIPKLYGLLQPSKFEILAEQTKGFGDMIISVPHSDATKAMIAALVKRQITAMTTPLEKFSLYHANARIPNTPSCADVQMEYQHPLQYQSNFDANSKKISWYAAERLPDSGKELLDAELLDELVANGAIIGDELLQNGLEESTIISTQVMNRTGNVTNDMKRYYSEEVRQEISELAGKARKDVLHNPQGPYSEGAWMKAKPFPLAQDDTKFAIPIKLPVRTCRKKWHQRFSKYLKGCNFIKNLKKPD